jgi:hypothetical protein
MSEGESEDVVARSRRLREAPPPGRWAIANAEFIASAPTLLAEMEAEVERLRGRLAVVQWERDELRGQLEQYIRRGYVVCPEL